MLIPNGDGRKIEMNNNTFEESYNQAKQQVEFEKAKKRKRNKQILLIMLIAVLSIAGVFAFRYLDKNNKYNKAMELAKSGHQEEAYEMLKELDDFKDSIEWRKNYKYTSALEMIDQGDLNNGYGTLLEVEDYQDASSILNQLEKQQPLLSILKLNIGDTFKFGHYEQDNDPNTNEEPIEWVLINKDNNHIYAISKYVLDTQQFNDTNAWGASIYNWLDTTFRSNAFSSEEQKAISRICLMKKSEINAAEGETAAVSIDLQAEYTPYAMSLEPFEGYATGYAWWYEEECSYGAGCASAGIFSGNVVTESGHSNYSTEVTKKLGVRPTIWLLTDEKDLPEEIAYDGSTSNYSQSNNSSSGNSNKPACYGGHVGCREGFHPCHEMSNGYCNQCCKDVP